MGIQLNEVNRAPVQPDDGRRCNLSFFDRGITSIPEGGPDLGPDTGRLPFRPLLKSRSDGVT